MLFIIKPICGGENRALRAKCSAQGTPLKAAGLEPEPRQPSSRASLPTSRLHSLLVRREPWRPENLKHLFGYICSSWDTQKGLPEGEGEPSFGPKNDFETAKVEVCPLLGLSVKTMVSPWSRATSGAAGAEWPTVALTSGFL